VGVAFGYALNQIDPAISILTVIIRLDWLETTFTKNYRYSQ